MAESARGLEEWVMEAEQENMEFEKELNERYGFTPHRRSKNKQQLINRLRDFMCKLGFGKKRL